MKRKFKVYISNDYGYKTGHAYGSIDLSIKLKFKINENYLDDIFTTNGYRSDQRTKLFQIKSSNVKNIGRFLKHSVARTAISINRHCSFKNISKDYIKKVLSTGATNNMYLTLRLHYYNNWKVLDSAIDKAIVGNFTELVNFLSTDDGYDIRDLEISGSKRKLPNVIPFSCDLDLEKSIFNIDGNDHSSNNEGSFYWGLKTIIKTLCDNDKAFRYLEYE